MKLRLMCLALCIMMVFPLVLTSCGQNKKAEEDTSADGTTTDATSHKAETITLYSITDGSTTDEAVAQVQAALNKITEKDFNTHILLKLCTEDEYDKLIEEKSAAIEQQILDRAAEEEAKKAAEKAAKESAKAAGETTTKKKSDTEETTEETDLTIINEYGIEETVYPAEDGTQLDIFLVRGIDKLDEYAKSGLLTSLDEQLSIGSKILKQYVHPTYFTAAKVDGKTYAIPNNHVLGEYQYMLLDKTLMDKYFYDPDKVQSITDIEDFLRDVMKNEPEYTPLMNEPEQSVVYLTESPSLLGAAMPKQAKAGTSAAPKNLLSVTSFVNTYSMLLDLKSKNAIGNGTIDDGKKYAAAIVKGDPTTPELYKDNYYVSVYNYPTATNDNVYSGMYAISKYASNPVRCMEIINYLTTNADFINVFQYGVKGMHYEIDETTGLVNKLSNEYSMNSNYTGNQFMMMASSDMSPLLQKLAADNWKLAKQQNLDMVYSPYLGFKINTVDAKGEILKSGDMTIKEIMDGVVASSDKYLKQIADFKEYEESFEESYLATGADGKPVEMVRTSTRTVTVADFIEQLAKDTAQDEYLVAATAAKAENSPAFQYAAWFAAAYPAPEAEAAPAA